MASTRQERLAKMAQINFRVRNYCKSQQFERYCQLERGGDESQNLFETSQNIGHKTMRKNSCGKKI